MYKNLFIVLSVLLIAVMMFGCTDRGTGIADKDYETRDPMTTKIGQEGGHEFAYHLGRSMFTAVRTSPLLDYIVYAPPGYDNLNEINNLPPLPVLYLLAPFRGTSLYYYNHGLVEVADRMIAEGEIEPMFIICVDGSAGYGGTFYGNTFAGGKYTDILGEVYGGYPADGSLIDWVESWLPTISQKTNRGISGLEMGGYGAVRVGIVHNDNFGSISAISSPLDFDGANSDGGFIPLFEQIVNNLDSDFRDMDTSYTDQVRTMMMAAGCAFSPHAFYSDDTTTYIDFFGNELNFYYSGDTTFIDDTLTLFIPDGTVSGIAFHLPFDENGDIPGEPFEISWPDSAILSIDSSGSPYDTTWDSFLSYDTIGYYSDIWDLWMQNNPENLLTEFPGALNNSAIKLFTMSSDQYGFDQQTRDFASFISADVTALDGYGGFDMMDGRYVYDILPQILKFHSDNFELNQ